MLLAAYLTVLWYRRPFYEKRISAEVEADFLGDEWKVSVVKLPSCLCVALCGHLCRAM